MKLTLVVASTVAFQLLTSLCEYGQIQNEVEPSNAFQSTLSQRPFPGVVPNKETAIAITVAVLKPMYGENAINQERPLIASLNGNVWTIVGTFNRHGEIVSGGVTTVRLSKRTGEILHVSASM